MLADELGYEDVDEFEDALKADFKTFIGALPHIETDNQESGAFYLTLVPVRPRRRGARRSLRTLLPGASLRPGSLGFDPDTPRRLSTPLLTPFNSTPTSLRMGDDPQSSSPGSGATSFASSPTRPRTSAARSGSCCRSSPGRTCGAC